MIVFAQILVFLGMFFTTPAFAKTASYTLNDVVTRNPVTVGFANESKAATVVVFLSAYCPCSMGHEKRLMELSAMFPRFAFVGIHANQDEKPENVQAHFARSNLPFPVLDDVDQRVANDLGAVKTPHVFVIGPKGDVLFEGGIDDSRLAIDAKKHYLEEALRAIDAGQPPSVRVVKTLGCSIRRVSRGPL